MEQAIAIANPVLDACNGPGSNHAMIWGHSCPIHGERVKPLDRAAMAVHFDCCVLCMCMWLYFVCGSNFLATIPVESQHRPRQNGQLLHTHITKSVPKDTKYIWMCVQNCHHSEMLHMFNLLVKVGEGHATGVQKAC
jgi:hypothetical protein